MSDCFVADTRLTHPSLLLTALYCALQQHVSALVSDAAY